MSSVMTVLAPCRVKRLAARRASGGAMPGGYDHETTRISWIGASGRLVMDIEKTQG
ncbi:MAG: hypothetical protein NTY46_07705 [Candidatus Sumerlaeota bacterium]|nr:hypothetical protein [Candidatus Sumerlaeota bacterium]